MQQSSWDLPLSMLHFFLSHFLRDCNRFHVHHISPDAPDTDTPGQSVVRFSYDIYRNRYGGLYRGQKTEKV